MESAQHARRTPDGLLFLTDFFIFCTPYHPPTAPKKAYGKSVQRQRQDPRKKRKIKKSKKREEKLRELEWRF